LSRYLVADTAGPVRVGGLPHAPDGTRWPACTKCNGPMQFLAQVALAAADGPLAGRDEHFLVFQCANDPGLCDEWKPCSGGNAALVVPRQGSAPLPAPVAGPDGLENPIVLPVVHLSVLDGEAAGGWLGRLGGEPDWLQDDETPACRCGRPMTFVFSLEEHVSAGINFGGQGVGYGFACAACACEARWLFQC
jgi:hypothetical protein